MKVFYAIMLNLFFAVVSLTLYTFIGFSAGLTAGHTDEWYGWAIFFGCIGLHVLTFSLIWKKSSRISYILGLAVAIAAYAWVIYIYAIKPSGRLP